MSWVGGGDLAFSLVHVLVGKAEEEDFAGGVGGVDSDTYATGDGEGAAGDDEGVFEGVGDAVEAADRDDIYRQVAAKIGGDDDELVATEASEGGGPDEDDSGGEIGDSIPSSGVRMIVRQ